MDPQPDPWRSGGTPPPRGAAPPAQDPFSRAIRDPWRPLRVYAPIMAVAGPLFLAAAIVLALSAFGAERTVVASADGPRAVLEAGRVKGAPDLKVYALIPPGGRPIDDCAVETSGSSKAFDKLYGGGSYVVAGEPLPQVAEVTGGWDDGDAVTCPRAIRLVAVAGGGAAGRLIPAGLALAVGVGATAMGVTGLRMRRSAGRSDAGT